MDVDVLEDNYHLNPVSESYTLRERHALLVANPTLWSSIPDDLPLLAPKGWLESSLIDWYILNQITFSEIPVKMTFIPCQIIADLQFYIQSHPGAETVPEEIKAKWENIIPPQHQISCWTTPKSLLMQHLSVYVFNHIFLNTIQEEKTHDDWTVWNGPQLWRLVADLMNWKLGPNPDNIRALSWFGNGSDCGVELTEILISLILDTGMRIDERGIWPLKPHLSCSHIFLEQMLYQILPEVTHWNNGIVMDQTKHYFESGLENIKSIQDIIQSLARQRMACHSCTLTPPSQPENHQEIISLHPADDISHNSVPNATGHQNQNLNHPLSDDGVDILTCNFRNIKIIRIDPDFDDYNTGPTLQETMGVPQHIKNFPIFNRTQLDPLSIWSLWTDYGYQIDNNFAQTFISQFPEQPEEHYLPINELSGEHILPESLKRWDLTHRNSTREAISDICFLGMQELLGLAGDPRSGNGFDLFIRGIRYDPEDCEKEEMVHLDITRDAIPTENVPVYISVDID
ncbi:hypothetical protein M422DRAFT_268479, partial [Sphaerobolus stellatus SS14]